MAINEQINVLFGLDGGDSLSGASGIQILQDLTTIAGSIHPAFVAELDMQQSIQIIESQIIEIQNQISSEGGLGVDLNVNVIKNISESTSSGSSSSGSETKFTESFSKGLGDVSSFTKNLESVIKLVTSLIPAVKTANVAAAASAPIIAGTNGAIATTGATISAATPQITAIALAFMALFAILEALIPSNKKLCDNLNESVQKLSDLKTQANEIDNALNEKQTRINEIEYNNTPEAKEELEILQKQCLELKRKKALNEEAQKAAAKDVEKSFNKWAKRQSNGDISDAESKLSSMDRNDPDSKAYKKSSESLSELITEENGFYDQLQKIEESGYKYGTNKDTDEYIDRLNAIIDKFQVLNNQADIALGSVLSRDKYEESNQAINDLMNSGELTGEKLTSLFNSTQNFRDMIGDMSESKIIDWKSILGDNFDQFDKNKDGLLDYNEVMTLSKTNSDLFSEGLNSVAVNIGEVADAASQAATQVTSFSDVINPLQSGYDTLTKAQQEMSENGFLSVGTIKAMESAGLTDYLQETEDGYVLATNALENFLKAQSAEYQTAVDNAVQKASSLATVQDAVAAGYENSAEGVAKYLEALAKEKEITDPKNAKILKQRSDEIMASLQSQKRHELAIKTIQKTQALSEKKKKAKSTKSQTSKTTSKTSSRKPKKTPQELQKEKFNKEYDSLKYKLDNDLISETAYLQNLDRLYKKYYSDKSSYLDEYSKYSKEVYSGFKKMYLEDLKNKLNAEKEALEKQKDSLKELAEQRKKALDDAKEKEDYKKEQAEKRKEVNDLKILIMQFRGNLSMSSQKKLRELQKELKEKQDELSDFEKNKALENAKETIDKEYESQEKRIQNKIDGIQERLDKVNDDLPKIRDAVLSFAKKKYGVSIQKAFASGTNYVSALTQESGPEIIAQNMHSGQFTLLTPGSKVWNAKATQFLYDFANSPSRTIGAVTSNLSTLKNKAFAAMLSQPVQIQMGDIIVEGNATPEAISRINKCTNNSVQTLLKAFKRFQN